MPDPYWNHNVHYHHLVLDAVPDGCREALDVGCGDGLLARKLSEKAAFVTGVDRSPEMIRQARGRLREHHVPGGGLPGRNRPTRGQVRLRQRGRRGAPRALRGRGRQPGPAAGPRRTAGDRRDGVQQDGAGLGDQRLWPTRVAAPETATGRQAGAGRHAHGGLDRALGRGAQGCPPPSARLPLPAPTAVALHGGVGQTTRRRFLSRPYSFRNSAPTSSLRCPSPAVRQ